jgi:hypothetical protein
MALIDSVLNLVNKTPKDPNAVKPPAGSRSEREAKIKDIQRELNINQDMVEQDNLILMNTAINGLINLASLA